MVALSFQGDWGMSESPFWYDWGVRLALDNFFIYIEDAEYMYIPLIDTFYSFIRCVLFELSPYPAFVNLPANGGITNNGSSLDVRTCSIFDHSPACKIYSPVDRVRLQPPMKSGQIV